MHGLSAHGHAKGVGRKMNERIKRVEKVLEGEASRMEDEIYVHLMRRMGVEEEVLGVCVLIISIAI